MAANPIAPPINGAVQGEATITVNTPEKKAPINPLCESNLPNRLNEFANSYTPARFNAIEAKRIDNPRTTHAFCNCNPHPTECPNSLNTIKTTANVMTLTITPATNPIPCFVEITNSNGLTFCEGDSVQLQPSVYDQNGTYLWNNNSSSHEIWVSSTGDYILNYTNDTGCVATDTVHIEVMPNPIIISNTVPSPPILCLGDTLVIELTSGFEHYYWNTGNPLHQDQNTV